MSQPKESANLFRLIRLVVDKGSDVLRDLLLQIIYPESLDKFLLRNINIINTLQLKKLLFQDQYDLLTKTPAVQPEELDITLLCWVFRNICNISPTNGWQIPPGATDLSLGDDIYRLREIRNKIIAHIATTQVPSADFKKLWVEISDIITRLAQHGSPQMQQNISGIIQSISSEELDPEGQKLKLKLIEALIQWKKQDEQISQKLEIHDYQLKTHTEELQKYAGLHKTHGEQLEAQKDQLKTHTEEMQKYAGLHKTHGERLEEQRDQLKTHTEELQKHAGLHKTHGEQLEEQKDQLKTHTEELQKHAGLHKTHGEQLEEQRDQLKTHTEELQNHAGLHKTHGEQLEEQKERLLIHSQELQRHVDLHKAHGEHLEEQRNQLELQDQRLCDVEKWKQCQCSAYDTGLSEQQKLIVKSWKEDDQLFVETTASMKIYDTLQKKKLLTIVGNSGCGKSAAARHIALRLTAAGYVVIPILNGLRDITESKINPSINQIYIWDDPVGTEGVNATKLTDAEDSDENIKRLLENSNIKIVLTCRTQIVQEAVFKASTSFIKANVIELHDNELILTKTEKIAILLKHAEKAKLEKSEIIDIPVDKLKCFNFPLLCRLYVSNKSYRERGEEFFLNPFPVILGELEKLKHSTRLKYYSLILCLVFDNMFDCKTLDLFSSQAAEQKEKISQLMEACGLSMDTSRKTVAEAMQSLEGVYLIKVGTYYSFIHDTLYEAIAYSFGKDYPLEMLKHATSSFIRDYVRLTPSTDGHFIVLSAEHHKDICKRLINDIEDGNSHDVFLSQLMQHSEFIEHFAQFLRGLTNGELTKLFIETKVSLNQNMPKKYMSCQDNSNVIQYSKTYYTVTILSHPQVKCIHFLLALGLSSLAKICLKKINISPLQAEKLSLLPVACFGGDIEVVNILMLSHNCTYNEIWHWENMSTLHMAALSGKVEMVQLVIQHGVDVNTGSLSQVTPLYIAAKFGFSGICSILLETTANIDLCNKDGQSPLHIAAWEGHTETVKLLLENKANINLCDKYGWSPLYIAAGEGHTETVKMLLENKANIDLCNKNGWSPLHIATWEGQTETVKLLLENKANIDLCNKNGWSPLYIAAREGHTETVKMLLENKANIDLCDKYGLSPLHIATWKGQTETVKLLLENKDNIDLCDKDGLSPLYIAAREGHTETVKMLLENKANIDLCNKDGWSPLHIATMEGQTETVKLLLENKANIDLCDKYGLSPLHIATCKGQTETVKLLLENKANIDLCNKDGLPPLYIAAREGHTETVKMLLENKANIDLCDKYGQSPLYIATWKGQTETVKLLLENKANIDLCNKDGQSPLHIAAKNGHTETVKMLLENKANIDLCDKYGQSPLYIATWEGQTETVKMLLENKANIYLCNKDGLSPLHIAAREGHTETVKMLLENKANIDLCNKDGQSPLHIAAREGHTEAVKMLLENKANIDLCNKDGQSPLHIAAKNGHTETVKMLLQNKANIDLCDKVCLSPYIQLY